MFVLICIDLERIIASWSNPILYHLDLPLPFITCIYNPSKASAIICSVMILVYLIFLLSSCHEFIHSLISY